MFRPLAEGALMAIGPNPALLAPIFLVGLILLSAILGAALAPIARESVARALGLGILALVIADVAWVFTVTLIASAQGGVPFLPVEAAIISFGAAIPLVAVFGSPLITLWALLTRMLN